MKRNTAFEALFTNALELLNTKDPQEWTTPEHAFNKAALWYDWDEED